MEVCRAIEEERVASIMIFYCDRDNHEREIQMQPAKGRSNVWSVVDVDAGTIPIPAAKVSEMAEIDTMFDDEYVIALTTEYLNKHNHQPNGLTYVMVEYANA